MVASKKEKPIIEVKHLSKQYSIGVDKTYKTLCDSLTSAVRSPLKTLKDYRRQNDTFWALKDVNFEVEKGEVVGIIGRNGAGKSTLLKVLSRITHPTEGEVRLRGRVGSLLEVGTGFHPELTGRENIYFNGAILGMRKREIGDKFDEIVKFAGVEKFLDTPVKRYSSGMQVRLAFSVAAHLDPEILVVDEVLAVGDAAFQKKCLGKMGEVAEGGRTVLFVSHNLSAVESLCSRILLINNGILVDDGLPKNIISQYLQQSQNEKQTISLLEVPRAGYLGTYIIISKCYLINSAGERTVHLQYGEPFSVCLESIAKMDLDNLTFQVRIDSIEGIPIAHALSSYSNDYYSVHCSQVLCIKVEFEGFVLFPGSYSITVGVRHHDQVQQALDFNILPIVYDKNISPYKEELGYIRFAPRWRIIDGWLHK